MRRLLLREGNLSYLAAWVYCIFVSVDLYCFWSLSPSSSFLFAVAEPTIECHTWTDDPTGKFSDIPEKWINDGYCDCRSGADEPETEACSGIESWPGRRSSIQPSHDDDYVVSLFQCPQQKKLKLPLSRINDGICDCCDGADEPAGLCEDECADILAAERAVREEFEAKFREGNKKREQAVQIFNDFKAKVVEQLGKKEADLFLTAQELNRFTDLAEKWKNSFLDFRLKQVYSRLESLATRSQTKEFIEDGLKGLLEALTADEMMWFIVHSCQLAGELPNAADGVTCVPLRLAGLDLAMVWDLKTYNFRKISEDDVAERKKLADLLDHNIRKPNAKKWYLSTSSSTNVVSDKSAGRTGGRRRLSAEDNMEDHGIYHDDITMGDDQYDSEHFDDGEDEEEEFDPTHFRRRSPPMTNEDDGPPSEKRDELVKVIKNQLFSKYRVAFLDEGSKIISRINEITSDDEEEEENVDDGEEVENVGSDDSKKSKEKLSVDPTALVMVKAKIQKLEKQISRGFDYAVSATVLLDAAMALDASEFSYPHLTQLALGIINHGNLSTLHVWQILQTIMPELQSDSDTADAQTCVSPLAAASCPPRLITRFVEENVEIEFPTSTIYKAGSRFCDEIAQLSSEQQCIASPTVDTSSTSTAVKIPLHIDHGFMGYFAPEPRSSDDSLFAVFRDLSFDYDGGLDKASREELNEIQVEIDKLENDKRKLEVELRELKESIGGDSHFNKFGPDGELQALKDTCHSVNAGKYTYELCIFGSASQKDRDQSGRGTDLGRWHEATVDEATGGRIWKWDRGAHCWNGPARSATAYVTCGPDTKVLSADEPDTCRYAMQMESYVACDNYFRSKHEL